MEIPRNLTMEERQKKHEDAHEKLNDFVEGKRYVVNLKELWTYIPQDIWDSRIEPNLRLPASMKLETVINGYRSGVGSNKSDSDRDGENKEGFFVHGIKINCPSINCDGKMQVIRHDVLLTRVDFNDGTYKYFLLIKPEPICPHCRTKFEIDGTEIHDLGIVPEKKKKVKDGKEKEKT